MRAKEIITESYTAFTLDKKSRRQLAKVFPPKYSEFIGEHITYKMGTKSKLPSVPKTVEVVGYVDDGESIEALVVEVNGTTRRPDGNIYHITWSLDRSKGRRPAHAKALIASRGYEPVQPIAIQAKPEIL